ncbi:AraC family transcriptional regulator [Mesorhizobium sp. VK25A]|uniref:AraC family transcriptional regulator n=1 Tax=Mesorhizobium vachelliae TaxID=3072309 RepID=A0ABU5AC73_9HYPH|nr:MULTISPECIES: AraC family transcriptional regulator [unclassified Mesorhizobium]MDX8534207.1 AraC family transcriptional regulator [Mesorhizobium sp. VK25D]MDX8546776.1 AraC family transcriptional regulator [Mesorhizobium sp. VK25A]
MADPLAEVVSLLQPSASFSKLVSGAGRWRVSRTESGRTFYCVILEGASRLTVDGHGALELAAGDFVLTPSAQNFTMTSLDPPPTNIESLPLELRPGVYRIGDRDGAPDLRMLVGYGVFGSSDAALLVSLLPQLIHVCGAARLTMLVRLVDEESRDFRPARDVILSRLLEVLLIEALRSTAGPASPPGLLRGLGDDRLAIALRHIHAQPTRQWTVVQLAKETALSRSAFFDRFRRAVGVAPMEYLLYWRMALAKDLLRRKTVGVAEVAERVGYGSASTFSTAFSRHVGLPPSAYAQQ